ncbi:MAG: rod shape-determining protein MreC [Candidatus Hydrogenedentes bacterium]|nr:rod shape-determining protein MreC [Candidatus Hydrogenedentota bacterium]
MAITRFMAEHRAEVTLATLSFLSLASLLSGTSSSIIQRGLTRVVSVTGYPFLVLRTGVEEVAHYSFDFVWRYDALRQENEENKGLKARLQATLAHDEELAAENRRLRDMIDFARAEPRLSQRPVRIIENLRGMLTIDQGRRHGIKRRMAVVTEHGVVGLVTEVHDFTAYVATLHHRDCRIAAMVHRNRLRAYDGVVKANGTDYNYICSMDFIDMKNDVRPGDIVVTSPESIFPPGLPIGTISVVHETGGALWRWAEIIPSVDPYVLDEAYVIMRSVPDEQFLAGGVYRDSYREATSLAPEMPDERPIQERLAP